MIIAVDGPAAAGKGTIARALAQHFGYHFLDTGALYRMVGLAVLRRGQDPADTERWRKSRRKDGYGGGQEFSRRGQDRAGLRDEGEIALASLPLGERGVEASGRRQHAEAIGTDQAHLVTTGDIQKMIFQGESLRRIFRKTTRFDDSIRNPFHSACFQVCRDRRGWGQDDGQVDAFW